MFERLFGRRSSAVGLADVPGVVYSIPVTGDAPLTMRAIDVVTTRAEEGTDVPPRRHEITVYAGLSGEYVVHVHWESPGREHSHDVVGHADSADEVDDFLTVYGVDFFALRDLPGIEVPSDPEFRSAAPMLSKRYDEQVKFVIDRLPRRVDVAVPVKPR